MPPGAEAGGATPFGDPRSLVDASTPALADASATAIRTPQLARWRGDGGGGDGGGPPSSDAVANGLILKG